MNSEKLILIIRKYRMLYDRSHPHYGDTAYKQKQWNKVADLMDAKVKDCKLKWMSLRNSYSRLLRNRKEAGLGEEQREKWYLANDMAFMKDHMQNRGSKKKSEVELLADDSTHSVFEDNQIPNNIDFDALEETPIKSPFILDSDKRKRKLSLEETVDQLIDTKKDTVNKISIEHPLLSYVQGLLPDYDELTPKRQRTFKQKLVTVMNDLMDQQEMEKGSTS